MAKGNPLLGQLRGKAGDLVFSRLKGQQIMKSRNRQPNNPRTNAQMTNRALFIGAVQFFSRALQAQFKFAFEGKKQKESDYNAFMRYNAKKGIYLMPEQVYDRTVTCVGEFMMTKGSLAQPTCRWSAKTEANKQVLYVSTGQKNLDTVAKLSQALIQQYNLNENDIFTMWVAEGFEYWNGESWEFGDDPVNWKIAQIYLNTTDTRTLAEATESQDAHLFVSTAEGESNGCITIGVANENTFTDATYVTIGGCCVTRVENGVVKASTSMVQMNTTAKMWYEYNTSPDHLAEVLAAWKATGTPILKGGIAVPSGEGNNPEFEGYELVPDAVTFVAGSTNKIEVKKNGEVIAIYDNNEGTFNLKENYSFQVANPEVIRVVETGFSETKASVNGYAVGTTTISFAIKGVVVASVDLEVKAS